MQYVSQIEPLRNSAAVKVNTREVNYVHGRRRTREKGEARKAKLTKRHTFLSISAGRAWNRLGLGPTILSGRVESGKNATAILKTFLFPSEPFSRTFRSLINPDLLSLLLRLLCNWKTFSIFYFPAPLMPQLFRFCRALAAHTFSFRQTFSNKYFSQFISQSLFAVWQNAFFFSCLFRAGKFFVCVISHRLAPRHVEHCRGQRNFPGSSRSWKQRTEKQKISFFPDNFSLNGKSQCWWSNGVNATIGHGVNATISFRCSTKSSEQSWIKVCCCNFFAAGIWLKGNLLGVFH